MIFIKSLYCVFMVVLAVVIIAEALEMEKRMTELEGDEV